MEKYLTGKDLARFSEPCGKTSPAKKCRFGSTSSNHERRLDGYFACLSREHSNSPSRMLHGILLSSGLVQLIRIRGKYLRFMGFSLHSQVYLHPEEALHLVQNDRLQLWDHEIPVSLEQTYTQLLGDLLTRDRFLIYSHLVKCGLTLRRRTDEPFNYNRSSSPKILDIPSSFSLEYFPHPITTTTVTQAVDTSNYVCASESDLLISPSSMSSVNELMKFLQSIVRPNTDSTEGSNVSEFLFDAYQLNREPNQSFKNFSKRNPLVPDFVVCRATPEQIYPSISPHDFDKSGLDDSTPVILTLVDGSDLSCHKLQAFSIPTLNFVHIYACRSFAYFSHRGHQLFSILRMDISRVG